MFVTQNEYDKDESLLYVDFMTEQQQFNYDSIMIFPENPLMYNYSLEINKDSEKEIILVIGGIYNKA